MRTWGSDDTCGLVNWCHLGLPYLALYPELKGFHHKLATGSESVLKITIFVGFFFFLHFEQIAGFQSNTVAKNIW